MDLIRFPLALQTKSIRFSEMLANENTQLTLQHLGGSPSYLGVVCDHPSGLSVLLPASSFHIWLAYLSPPYLEKRSHKTVEKI